MTLPVYQDEGIGAEQILEVIRGLTDIDILTLIIVGIVRPNQTTTEKGIAREAPFDPSADAQSRTVRD